MGWGISIGGDPSESWGLSLCFEVNMLNIRLKKARVGAGLSMHNLGKATGLSRYMIKCFEDGSKIPSSDILIKLARATGVRVEYFFRQTKPVNLKISHVCRLTGYGYGSQC